MQNASYPADLHCHTTASDGLLTPSEIIALAKSRNLQALAITDHDTVDGLNEARQMAERVGIHLITGVEINTDWHGKEVHILGYGIKTDSDGFNHKLKELRAKRAIRVQRIIEKLRQLGISITFEQITQNAGGDSLGRPHIALALVRQRYTSSVKEAFDKYLKNGAPAYVPRYKLKPAEAIQIIRQAGGVAVLAHPGSEGLYDEITGWVGDGLQGIEVSHPDHTAEKSRKYARLSRELKLLATGGSDFHGKGVKPGIELGAWGVNMNIVEAIERMSSQ